jgi:hypothetical protein
MNILLRSLTASLAVFFLSVGGHANAGLTPSLSVFVDLGGFSCEGNPDLTTCPLGQIRDGSGNIIGERNTHFSRTSLVDDGHNYTNEEYAEMYWSGDARTRIAFLSVRYSSLGFCSPYGGYGMSAPTSWACTSGARERPEDTYEYLMQSMAWTPELSAIAAAAGLSQSTLSAINPLYPSDIIYPVDILNLESSWIDYGAGPVSLSEVGLYRPSPSGSRGYLYWTSDALIQSALFVYGGFGAASGSPGGPGTSVIPEPGALPLLLAGLGLIGLAVRRRGG